MEDGYAWSVSEEKRHLLETTLGRGTVGLYQNIIDEIGKSIEAVDPRIFQKDSTNDGHDEKRQVSLYSHRQNIILIESFRKQN